jgi:O-acetyl-ADP-ribose deacetylase (regulator of RNase III)
MIRLIQGDLLKQDDVDAIVNTVNCVGVMGKGIALQFKNRWPANFAEYAAACKAGQVRPGRMLIYDSGGLVKPNYIINFPTKEHWRGTSKIEFIEDGLVDLVSQVRRLRIRSIAIPPLGCGNGGLSWNKVRPLIEGAFASLPEVEVRLFEPKGAPEARSMQVRSKRPKMTAGRAAIVKVLDTYRVATREPAIRSVNDAVTAVRAWNDRKRALMKPEHVAFAWHRLEAEGSLRRPLGLLD